MRRFKNVFGALIVVVFVWLTLTALTYWDIALGGSMLQHIDQLKQESLTILRANPALDVCIRNQAVKDDAAKVSCLQLQVIAQDLLKANEDLTRYSQCRGIKRFLFIRCWAGSNFVGRNIGADRRSGEKQSSSPAPALHGSSAQQTESEGNSSLSAQSTPGAGNQPQSSGQQAGGQNAVAGPERQGTPADQQVRGADGQALTSVISVFSTLVLPMMFGLLGTLVATIRSVHDKMRDNLLSPRDHVLMLTGLPIGAIAGLVVGLFINPAGSTPGTPSGLTGGLSLSAGGLAFLAGYAADAFFSFLDSIRSQVFAATNPPPGADGAAPRAAAGPAPARPALVPTRPAPAPQSGGAG